MPDKYRILFAPDGKNFIDHKDNDYPDPSEAVMLAREHCMLNHLAKCKVVNAKTKFVIWDSQQEAENNSDGWISQARKRGSQ